MKLDVIKLAKEAGLCNQTGGIEGDSGCFYDYSEEISRFAALVIEECAKVCEDADQEYEAYTGRELPLSHTCANAIRELKEPE